MKRQLVALGAALLLIAALVPPVAATAPGWDYFRWIPTLGDGFAPEPGPGVVCGVGYDYPATGGWVDFWAGPTRGTTQQVIQHWNGTLTFSLSSGHSVTIREDYWLYGVRDFATGTETDTSTGLIEEMSATQAKTKLTDIGVAITRTDPSTGSPTALKLLGKFPIRGSGYDAGYQSWNAECSFFQTYLK